MTSKRIGFEWVLDCFNCKHQCPLMETCNKNHNLGAIMDSRGNYILKCIDYEFDGIQRVDIILERICPDIFRPDMFKQYRFVVECKELTL